MENTYIHKLTQEKLDCKYVTVLINRKVNRNDKTLSENDGQSFA